MKNLQEPNAMGSNNQSITLPPINLPPINKPTSSHSRDLSKRSQSRLSQRNEQLPDSLITTLVDGHRTQFTLSPKSQQLIIKCISNKTNKKFITHYKYQLLPKAIQITYKSLQQLFEEIKYIVDENISNRLAIGQDGKLIFSLQTKKKGKSQYLAEVFDLQEENQEKVMNRLQEEVSKLKEEDSRKSNKINQLQRRLAQLQKILRITSSQKQHLNMNDDPILPQQFSTIHSPLTTIQINPHDNTLPRNQSRISSHELNQQESIIKKFKRTKSTENLQLKQASEKQLPGSQNDTLLKTTIKNYDVFVQLEQDTIKLELLSRKEAKIYKALITQQTIPKQVYSFVPTPKHLYDEIAYIISHKIVNRLDVSEHNFIYRASINTKNQQTLVDGVFETSPVEQNDLERIEDLVDLRTTHLQTSVKELKLEMELLKVSLQSNDIILERPQGFMDSKIVDNSAHFITLFRFFKTKIFKISLLYRASQNDFEIKKFHQKCDGIPNTLTIVLTQFNKIIGGFTSEQWDKNGNGKSISDYQSHSFIFSLTNRHKFTLEQHQHAIQTGAQDGPRFGNGADLVIKDKANQNNNSYANICTSYTHPRYVYKNSDSYKYFSGDDKTNRFGVKEWEVFELFFEE